MVDTVTTQTLVDGPRNAVLKFTNESDGTGESAVTKVDVSALSGAPSTVKIDRIWFSTQGMGVEIFFDATADVLAFTCPADEAAEHCFRRIGGIQNNSGAGQTGNINFSTVGATAGDSYVVILYLKKT